MSSLLADLVNGYRDELKKHMERGDYFYRKEDYQQALIDFSGAFEQQASILEMVDNNQKGKAFEVEYSSDKKMSHLSSIGGLLMLIIKCYIGLEKIDEVRYFTSQLRAIADKISENENNLNVQILENLQNFRDSLSFLEEKCIGLDEIPGNFISDDPSFSKIQNSFNRICNLSIFPLSATESNSSCFVATAIYETANHADLDTFRQFRDYKLLPNHFGRKLISTYYRFGPGLAIWVSRRLLIRKSTYKTLKSIAKVMRKFKITTY
jgi:hypothetical protein